ncbi:phage tail protein, partial [Cronobacter sakazakii]
MATETFTWCPRINAGGEVTHRVRRAQFGDGYAQASGDGINARGQKWDLEFVG